MQFHVKNIFFLLLVGLFVFQCSDGKKEIRNFYFPLKALEEGLVYEYRPVNNDSLTPIYWYYRSLINEDAVYLTGTYYEYNFEPLQFIREELVKNGMLLEDIKLYQTDTTGNVQTINGEIISGTTFPFEVSDESGIFLYKVSFDFSETQTVSLIKNRRYLRDTTIQVDDQKKDAVVFEVRELVEVDDREQGGVEPEFGGVEIYAEGVGLVFYSKELGQKNTMAYQLYRRYPMEELEHQFKEYMKQ